MIAFTLFAVIFFYTSYSMIQFDLANDQIISQLYGISPDGNPANFTDNISAINASVFYPVVPMQDHFYGIDLIKIATSTGYWLQLG
ncbi:MAG: hypothetical protein ACP5UO_06445, partial [Thermoplasmata archaeon]